MATRDRETREPGPSFEEVLDDNAPYIGAMYLINLVLIVAFVDWGALLQGRLAYTTLLSSETLGVVTEALAAAFAVGFVAATVVAFFAAASVFGAREGGEIDAYAVEERISVITIVPAIQLLAVILCPVLTGHTLAEGVLFLPQFVGALL